MPSKGQGVQLADAAIHSYRAQIAELESERASVASDLRVVADQLREALAAAASMALPDATPTSLERAAGELGMPWLPGRRQELEQKRGEWARRLAQIEVDHDFVRRQALLHATHGELEVQRRALRTANESARRLAAELETETFRWLQARTAERAAGRGALGSFWDTLTFSDYREEKARQRCAQELRRPSYDQVFAEHTACQAALHATSRQLSEVDARRTRLLGLLDEHAKLYTWTHDFEGRLLEMLRGDIVNALWNADLGVVHGRAQPAARGVIAKAHALSKKSIYLKDLLGFFGNQIGDREGRIRPLQATRATWAMKPRENIAGDKSKWLVGLPAAKKESTHKQVRWARRMHQSVIDYEDYDDYDYYLSADPSFLAYDAFAHASNESMPHEGFSRTIVHEIGSYREAHHQERPDYGAYRAMDNEASAEDRAHHALEDTSAPADGADESASEDLSDAEAGLTTDDGGGDSGDSGNDDPS